MTMVLEGLVSAVMEKLVDAGSRKIASILGVNSEMEALQRNMMNISRVLDKAKSKKIENESINHWLAELREVLCDAEDLLDDCQVEADQKVNAAGDTSSSWIASLLSTFFQFIFSVAFKNEIATIIEEINSTLDRLNSKALSLQLMENLPDADKKVSRYNSSLITDTSSFQLDSVVGIDDDATDLVDRIIRDSDCEHSVFAITGMGGSGKTTLARKVLNHKLIEKHFDNNVWICVSSNRSGEELLKEIVRFFDKNYRESRFSLNELSSKLIEVVKEKRVFIVLDDIWDSRVWEEFLEVPLSKAEKHSRILITTRNKQVAMKMDAAYIHRMTKMNPSDGLSMLWKIVFKRKDNGDMNKLVDVGKEIVHKCNGLPLAIKVVGGVLKMTDRTTAAWEGVLSSTTWSMKDLPKEIPPSLLLSYEDLPLHLKQCFAYCSLFPEDYEISRFNLQHLWIAEGFIEKGKERSLEYSARECYDELVMRNLLQEFPSNFLLSFCKMHDLLRSLAVHVSQNQYIYLQSENFHNSGLTRHHYLSFIGNDREDEVLSQEIKEDYRVRTLLLSKNPRFKIVSSELLSNLGRLRVLDLEDTGVQTLPDSLGALIHLRFLNISRTQLTKLPDSIKNLKNLETLEATGLKQLRSLPVGISQLFNLRCLRVDRLDNMPNGLDNLKNLRILKDFVVNDWSSSLGRQYTPNLRELRDLSQLTDLSIHNLERVAGKNEAKEAAIERKKRLEILTLSCEPLPITYKNVEKIEKVFAGIKLPQNLRELSIDGFFGEQLPDHLRQVTSLELRNCKLLRGLPFLGDMPKLQRLEIENAESVVKLGSEFLGSSKFPELQELKVTGMRNLKRMFEVEEGAFPCLVKLSITNCPQLISLGKGLNHATCLKMLSVRHLDNLKSIENLSSISELTLEWNETLSSVKNLPSLKILDISRCPALEDVRNVGELSYLYIQDNVMDTLPRWLKSINPPKKLSVVGSEELVLTTHQSIEDRNFIQKYSFYVEDKSSDGSKYMLHRKDHSSFYSNTTGSIGASSSSVTITEHVNDL